MTQQFVRSDVVIALAIQWTLVLAAGWAVRSLTWGASAATRSALGRATLVCVIAAPFLAMAAAGMRVPRVAVSAIGASKGTPIEASQRVRSAESVRVSMVPVGAASAPANETVRRPENEAGKVAALPVQKTVEAVREPSGTSVLNAGIAVLVVVSLAMLIRVLVASVLLRYRRQRASSAPAHVAAEVESLARQLGIRAPAVKMSRGVMVPCLTGILRPIILLPGDRTTVEPEVLVHELAHLLRRDCAWGLVTGVAAAGLWWHPLAWVLVRRMERDAEEACDDFVVLHGGERSRYARVLVETAGRPGRVRLLPALAPAVLSRGSVVGRRVRRLLDAGHAPRAKVSRTARYALGVYVLVMGMVCTLVRAGGAIEKVAAPGTPAAPADKQHGRVIDAAGSPVAGAEVYLLKYGPSLEITSKVASDNEGRFEFNIEIPADPANNRYDVQTVVPGKGVGEARPQSGTECVIQLIAPTRITLTVLGPDGKPVAGLRMFPVSFAGMPARGVSVLGVPSAPRTRFFFMKMPPELYGPMGGVTDERGSVTLGNLPRGQGFELGFDDDRFARPGIINRIGLAENSDVTPPETIRLEQAATISGAVRYGPTGKPAAGLLVSAQATRNNYPPRSLSGGVATTDANGAYRMTGLAGGEYNVMVGLDPDVQKQWVAAPREAVKIEGGQNLKDVDLALVKGGIVKGKVVTADTAQPIRARVTVQSGEVFGASPGSVETGPDGSYSVRVRPGPQRVFLSVVAPDVYRQAAQQPREVQAEEGQTVNVDFLVPRREGQTVEGVVIGVDGKPAAGVVVKAEWGAVWGNPVTVTTDGAGRFRLERLPLDGQIYVDAENIRTTEPTSLTRDMGPVRLQLVRKFVLTLKGLVTDDVGKPVPNARIELSQVLGSSSLSGLGGPLVSDSGGRYEIKDLHGGYEYELLATAAGHGEARERFDLNTDTKQLPTLKTPRADLATGGVVVDESGKPAATVKVFLNDAMETRATVADVQGKFSFTVVRGKRYVVWAASTAPARKSDEVDQAGGRTDLKLVLHREDQ